mmetsp:Transcript_6376/g.16459  ORF Transcript_6376/g.16459 Transcript_6376/m.16459 type:complete len:339 (+) Transcript_6376:677-1693(+)
MVRPGQRVQRAREEARRGTLHQQDDGTEADPPPGQLLQRQRTRHPLAGLREQVVWRDDQEGCRDGQGPHDLAQGRLDGTFALRQEAAQRVERHQERRALVDGDREPEGDLARHRGQGGPEDGHHGQGDVLLHDVARLAGHSEEVGQRADVVRAFLEHDRIRRRRRRRRCGVGESNAHVRGGEGGRIVDAVADHGDITTAGNIPAHLLHVLDLVLRQQARVHLADAQLLGNEQGIRLVVPRQHRHLELARVLQIVDRRSALRLDFVGKGEQSRPLFPAPVPAADCVAVAVAIGHLAAPVGPLGCQWLTCIVRLCVAQHRDDLVLPSGLNQARDLLRGAL